MGKNDIKKDWWGMGIGPDSAGWIGRSEREMIRFLEKEMGELDEDCRLAILFVSLFLKAGHTSLPLDQTPKEWGEIIGLEPGIIESLPGRFIDPKRLAERELIGNDKKPALMNLSESGLSMSKYHSMENKVIQWITKKSKINYNADISKYISQIFPKSGQKEVNWQIIAAVLSTFRRVVILSGGPGTGKTTTVARMLVLNQLLMDRPLRIALAAPTGKAAGRMGEALHRELEIMSDKLNELELSKDHFPQEAKTVHRLLSGMEEFGILPPVQKKKLPYDLVVVDEASMMDLELMNSLISHMNESARLILMGDKDQLSSVEAGSVLADLCQKPANGFSPGVIQSLRECGVTDSIDTIEMSQLDDAIVYLTKSYRFDESSGIGRLAQAVNKGASSGADLDELFSGYKDLKRFDFNYEKEELTGIFDRFKNQLKEASHCSDPLEMLQIWKSSVWLSPLRSGLIGTERLNRLLESYLRVELRLRNAGEWYQGRPVIITSNDYSLGVYNGDLGVCLQDEGRYWVYFESGSDVTRVRADQIQYMEPFYFLTVHKSQGSEFDEVNLMIPLSDHKQLVTRELIYTAITRAKHRFNLYGSTDLFLEGVRRKTERYTGLKRSYSDLSPDGCRD